LVNLLIYLFEYQTRVNCLVADDGFVSIVWCKHGFQRRRSNFDGKFKGYWAKNSKEFLITETEQTFFKRCKNWHDGKEQTEAAALKAYRISFVFLFCNTHTQTGYYKKGICH